MEVCQCKCVCLCVGVCTVFIGTKKYHPEIKRCNWKSLVNGKIRYCCMYFRCLFPFLSLYLNKRSWKHNGVVKPRGFLHFVSGWIFSLCLAIQCHSNWTCRKIGYPKVLWFNCGIPHFLCKPIGNWWWNWTAFLQALGLCCFLLGFHPVTD